MQICRLRIAAINGKMISSAGTEVGLGISSAASRAKNVYVTGGAGAGHPDGPRQGYEPAVAWPHIHRGAQPMREHSDTV